MLAHAESLLAAERPRRPSTPSSPMRSAEIFWGAIVLLRLC